MQGDHDPQADQDGLNKDAAPRWASPELRHVAAETVEIAEKSPHRNQSLIEVAWKVSNQERQILWKSRQELGKPGKLKALKIEILSHISCFLVFKNTCDTCELYCLIVVVVVVVVVLRRRVTQKSMCSERAATMNDRRRLHLQRCCCCCFCYLMFVMEISGFCAMLENVQQRIFFTYSRIFAVFHSIFALVPQLESSQLLMGDVTSLQRCCAQFKQMRTMVAVTIMISIYLALIESTHLQPSAFVLSLVVHESNSEGGLYVDMLLVTMLHKLIRITFFIAST